MINCCEAFKKDMYIQCNDLEEFGKVLTCLGANGFNWVTHNPVTPENIAGYRCVPCPYYVVRFGPHKTDCISVAWGTDVKNKDGKWFCGKTEMNLVRFDQVSF